ncbi:MULTISPECIES: AI-2E family transporter [unclassified Halanaerobium]|uniref:AI-2E family transporter n=1 Tax=unclassified Halanaerobium TaxID=2641197 RepID=UPI000DF18932|nr:MULTISPECIES: AI-2E family transporter [unclassified Halanaerobium]RCW48668.1 putative PurR-regulated permease PerM [Halanaerobium sp. MA284_MarDTE_T2]RCW86588.1 putative PurR-regulated permease PerM [Halanaerobium sp. DL-01]
MTENKFFRNAYAVILVLLIIFLAGQIPYVMKPLTSVLSFVLLPLLFGGFLYYLLRPSVRFLNRWIKSKAISIIITLLAVILLLILIFYFGGSIIYNEVKELSRYYSSSYEIILNNLEKLRGFLTAETDYLQELNLQERVINYANRIIQKISTYNYMGIFASITNVGMIIVLIPFVLFYLLKDDEKIYKNLMRIMPKEKKESTKTLLIEIDQVLSTFISSQLVVALLLGVVMLVGFLIIGLPNAITLALIAMITSLVPIIGPIIGSLPAFFVALSKGFVMIFGVGIVLLIAQYLEGNLIRPFVQGKRLEIHPLVVLFVVLAAVYLFGFIGALTAVPIYVILRLIFKRKYLTEIEE